MLWEKGKRILVLLVILVMVFNTCVVHAYPMHDFVRVLPAKQEKCYWCWAACSQSVLDYFGRYVSQSDFCRAAKGGVYNSPAIPREILDGLSYYGVSSRIWSYLYFDSIKSEISIQRRPMLIGWLYPYTEIGHLVLANGYAMLPMGEDCVSIMDPETGRFQLMDYNVVRGGYAYDHFWAVTIYDFR